AGKLDAAPVEEETQEVHRIGEIDPGIAVRIARTPTPARARAAFATPRRAVDLLASPPEAGRAPLLRIGEEVARDEREADAVRFGHPVVLEGEVVDHVAGAVHEPDPFASVREIARVLADDGNRVAPEPLEGLSVVHEDDESAAGNDRVGEGESDPLLELHASEVDRPGAQVRKL